MGWCNNYLLTYKQCMTLLLYGWCQGAWWNKNQNVNGYVSHIHLLHSSGQCPCHLCRECETGIYFVALVHALYGLTVYMVCHFNPLSANDAFRHHKQFHIIEERQNSLRKWSKCVKITRYVEQIFRKKSTGFQRAPCAKTYTQGCMRGCLAPHGRVPLS